MHVIYLCKTICGLIVWEQTIYGLIWRQVNWAFKVDTGLQVCGRNEILSSEARAAVLGVFVVWGFPILLRGVGWKK